MNIRVHWLLFYTVSVVFLFNGLVNFRLALIWPPRRIREEPGTKIGFWLFAGFFSNIFIHLSTNTEDHSYCTENVSGREQRRSHSMSASCPFLLGHMACCYDSSRKTRPSSSAYLPWLFYHQSPGCCNYCSNSWWDWQKHARGTQFLNPTCSVECM